MNGELRMSNVECRMKINDERDRPRATPTLAWAWRRRSSALRPSQPSPDTPPRVSPKSPWRRCLSALTRLITRDVITLEQCAQ